jgi:hypothetical protein
MPDVVESLGPTRCSEGVAGRLPMVESKVIPIGTDVLAAAAVIGRGRPISHSGRGCMQQSGGVRGHFDFGTVGGHGTRSPGLTL